MMLNAGDDPDLLPPESQPPPASPPPAAPLVVNAEPRVLVVNARGANSAEAPRLSDAAVAAQCLPHVGADDYHAWLTVGMALHAIDQGGGMLAAWDAWSRGSPKYDDGACARKWATFHADRPKRVGVGTLVRLARAAGADVRTTEGGAA